MPYNATFDPNQFAPSQSAGGHPVGSKFPFTITNTSVEASGVTDQTPQGTGGMFVVEMTSPSGTIKNRYNLWNQSARAVEIAHGQLSALCHAVAHYQVLDFKTDGATMRGLKGQMDVGYQKGHEPTPENPTGGFVEVKKVYDINGNEPGKGHQQQPQGQQGFSQTNGAQPQQGFGNPNQQAQNTAQSQPQPQQAAAQNLPPVSWQGQANPTQQAPQGQAGAWQPGGNGAPAGGNPPWGSRQ